MYQHGCTNKQKTWTQTKNKTIKTDLQNGL